jgi:NDP-sugar pyrophosphorylase family protein
MRAIILAGGRGTRLVPYTTVLPKPLMPIGDIPILEIVIRQLKYYGFKRITLTVWHQAALIETFFGNGKKFGVKIDYSRENTPLGTAGPLSLINDLNKTFLVMNGDLLTNLDYSEMLKFHKNNNAFVTMALYQKRVKIDLGVIKTDERGFVKHYIEKPTMKYDVSTGIYVFQPQVRRYIMKEKKFDLPDLIKLLIKENKTIIGYQFKGYWLDIGRYEDYQNALNLFEKQKHKFLPG